MQQGLGALRYNPRMELTYIKGQQLAQRLSEELQARQLRICTAESCTGGLIAKTFTDLAGSSLWFERGFVTYSNEAKTEMLEVPAAIINEYGAVSEPVAVAMATGALRFSRAQISIAVTGVAGPGGGSEEKPVGTVWIAVAGLQQTRAVVKHYGGDRQAIREATLLTSLEMALELVGTEAVQPD